MRKHLGPDSACSVARSLDLLGDKWMLLIVREALVSGTTRFSDFKEALGIAPNILANRLDTLVEEGLMERHSYRERGARERSEYALTEAGKALNVVIAGLATWGRAKRPREGGNSPAFTVGATGEIAELAFVTADGRRVSPECLVSTRVPDVPE
ncbi:DNA-binding HxlR family transcriptional regulator [Pseudarthrobacter sp. W1I19]|uniref:winged helix-turn-helix transcriptional regulator n=1 Tax=Pseudarthrobacter sp. W1I19 TaxID=3042288 RepID=UPI00278A1800|nr:helix-turn-helix domain-containing protein [Pseudarthrobacter sp. W1I19]MDQ0923835.1 DNA-binding HxlR family transcriptional regulator [Pseudarthrobacter sp. W1I19]